MAYELKPYNKFITNEELLDDLRMVAQKLGVKTVLYDEYPKHGRCASRVFETRFGSWNQALKAAGLEVTRRQDISELELFENLEQVWRALGRQPRREELRRPLSAFSGGTYERRFRGWRPALEAFISYANSDGEGSVSSATAEDPVKTPRFPDLRLRFRVLSRDSYKCQACGRSPATEHGVTLHIDHVVPWSAGGPTTLPNLKTLCERCNLGKGNDQHVTPNPTAETDARRKRARGSP